jgi:hypothetical protein
VWEEITEVLNIGTETSGREVIVFKSRALLCMWLGHNMVVFDEIVLSGRQQGNCSWCLMVWCTGSWKDS